MGRIDTYPSGSQIIPVTGSTLAYAEVTANQTGISTETALTGLSVNISVPAGKRIRVSGQVQITSATTGATVILRIKDGSTTVQLSQENYNTTAGNGKYVDVSVVLSPSAGSHTYSLTLQGTSGTIDLNASSATPSFILVEDVTGSQYSLVPPYVPVGQLAYGQRTGNQTGIGTTPVLIGGLSVNVSVPAGRQIKITGFLPTFTKTSGAPTWVRAYIRRNGVDVQRTIESANNDTFTALTIEHVESPAAGSHTYEIFCDTDTGTVALDLGSIGTGANAFILVEDVTQSPLAGQGAPGSTLAYAQVTADQGTFTAETDLTGLSITVTVPAGRRLRITGGASARSSVADDRVVGRIKEGSTDLGQFYLQTTNVVGQNEKGEGSVIVSPSAGSHTYKLAMARANGTGNITMGASTDAPAFILVEDITGAVWPAGSEVTAGMIAPDPWISYVPSNTNVTLGDGTQRAFYQKIGTTVHISYELVFGTTTTFTGNIVIGLPFPAANSPQRAGWFGTGHGFDSGTNFRILASRITSGSTGVTLFHDTSASGNINATTPFTWANTDVLRFSITYEAAS